MTDNRTTELREKLTERGVEWKDVSNGFADVTVFVMNGIKWTVISKSYLNPENDWMKMNAERITPEQAIAVTLGSESVDYMLNTIGKLEEENERLRSSCGTLTAKQVSEAIEKCFDFDVWVPSERGQAIADELNAERHVETCRITASSTNGLCSDNPRRYFELSCGHSFTINGLDAPVACAVCGKVVKNAD